MTDKKMRKNGQNKRESGDKNGNKGADEDAQAVSRGTSGDATTPEVASRRTRHGNEEPADSENMPSAIAFFLIELKLNLEVVENLNEATYIEFDRLTPDEAASRKTIDPIELLDLNGMLELLGQKILDLAQKARAISARFRNSLLEAGVEAADLAAETNQKRKIWPSAEVDRVKKITMTLSEKELGIRTQLMLAFTALSKLHEALTLGGNDHAVHARIDELAAELICEIDKIMKILDGGEVWKIVRPSSPK